MMRKVLIGTSGWGYDEWVGAFYPKGLKKEEYLSYYSKVYFTNEINTTFYNIPNKWTVDNWIKKTPDNFVFTAIRNQNTGIPQIKVKSCLLS